MSKANVRTKTVKMAQTAVLTAVIILMAFTPLGYFRTATIEVTLIPVAVAVGAIAIGPSAGALLGGVFGITSFIQCFGMSAFGAFLLSLNPVYTFIICIIPRILCGWLSGLLFKWLRGFDKTKLISYAVASLSTALLNTLFFMGSIIMFFWHNTDFIGFLNDISVSTESIWLFLVGFVGINGVLEAVVCLVLGAAIAKAIHAITEKSAKA